jgi:hypothetical protein
MAWLFWVLSAFLNPCWAGEKIAGVDIVESIAPLTLKVDASLDSPKNLALPVSPDNLKLNSVIQNQAQPLTTPVSIVPQTKNTGRKLLIETLSQKMPDAGTMNPGTLRRDFESRAQLDQEEGATSVLAEPSSKNEALIEAYQDGRLDELGVLPGRKQKLEAAAQEAIKEQLGKPGVEFKTWYVYGVLGTRMYESPQMPGVLLKTYFSPLGPKLSRALSGYTLAKERLGGLFAETSIVRDVEVSIDGKKKRLKWALVQEKVKVEDIADYRQRMNTVLWGMLRRGVRDNDKRRPGLDQLDIHRNLGETNSGKLVHFDADFFSADSDPEEGPKRVRDPPVLRQAIAQAQRRVLEEEERVKSPSLDSAAAVSIDALAEKIVSAVPADRAVAVKKHLKTLIAVARHNRVDERPAAKYLAERVADVRTLYYNKEFHLSGNTSLENGVLTVSVFIVNHEPLAEGVFSKAQVRIGQDHNPKGASLVYAQAAYDVLRAAALKAASDSQVKSVRIEAFKVKNDTLKDTLTGLGFVLKDPRLEHLPSAAKSYVLDIPVR